MHLPLSIFSHFISQSEHYWNHKAKNFAVLIKIITVLPVYGFPLQSRKVFGCWCFLTNFWLSSGFCSKWPIKLCNLWLVSNFGRLRLLKFAQEWLLNLTIYHHHPWQFPWFDQLMLSCQKVSKMLSKFNLKLSQMVTVWCKTL